MDLTKITQRVNSTFALVLNVLPVIFWLCLIYSFDEFMGANITVLAMIIHECGHLICVYVFTGRFSLPKGDISGLRISKEGINSYGYDIALYSSGIFFNLIAVFLMLPFLEKLGDFAALFVTINLATAVSNALPIEGYDGYRIIILTFSYFCMGKSAYIILEFISFMFVFLMSILSLFLVYTYGNGYWIMAIFLGATISKLKKWMKKSDYDIFQDFASI